MQELIAKLQQQANLNEEQAQKAADVIKGFLLQRLPESLHGPVTSALTGENVQGGLGQAAGMLGGLFGKKDDEQK